MIWIAGAVLALLALHGLLTNRSLEPEESVAKHSGAETQRSVRQRVQPQLDRNEVKAKLSRVRTALYMYNAESGEIPAGFNEVIEYGYLQRNQVADPWGRDFAFRSEKKASSNAFSEEYEIFVYSKGPDGVADNSDDIYL